MLVTVTELGGRVVAVLGVGAVIVVTTVLPGRREVMLSMSVTVVRLCGRVVGALGVGAVVSSVTLVVAVSISVTVSRSVVVILLGASEISVLGVAAVTVLVTVLPGRSLVTVSVIWTAVVVTTTVLAERVMVANVVDGGPVVVIVAVIVLPGRVEVQGRAGIVTVVDAVGPVEVSVCVTSCRPSKDEQNDVALRRTSACSQAWTETSARGTGVGK